MYYCIGIIINLLADDEFKSANRGNIINYLVEILKELVPRQSFETFKIIWLILVIYANLTYQKWSSTWPNLWIKMHGRILSIVKNENYFKQSSMLAYQLEFI